MEAQGVVHDVNTVAEKETGKVQSEHRKALPYISQQPIWSETGNLC
jgi:hypothetical protein